jgi:hypothetical protein
VPNGTGKLSAELLATTGATSAQNLAATGSRLAREETVTTGTHEIAGLERPLHIILEKLEPADRRATAMGQPGSGWRAYGKACPESSRASATTPRSA